MITARAAVTGERDAPVTPLLGWDEGFGLPLGETVALEPEPEPESEPAPEPEPLLLAVVEG